MEPTVIISARSKDVSIVEKASEGAKAQYKEISGREVEYSLNGDLSDNLCVSANVFSVSVSPIILSSAGGVKIASGNGRINLDNTLDERLRLLEGRVRILAIC